LIEFRLGLLFQAEIWLGLNSLNGFLVLPLTVFENG
jgi:hypothetical protein